MHLRIVSLLCALVFSIPVTTQAQPRSVLFQVSTLDALLQGLYGASFSIGQLREHGDFGLGTYEGLDGEMIVVDGHFYQMRANGILTEAADSDKVPFAVVTQFKPDVQFSARQVTLTQLSELIDTVLPTRNHFYAIRIHGLFQGINTRAIFKQFLPYPALAQLLPTQTEFSYTNVTGTLVDIRSPSYISGINQIGHHYHFVSDDRKAGGHALNFTAGEVTVEIQAIRRHSLWLPDDEPFRSATLPLQ